METKVFQIVDVNLNRVTEGLRVVEEVARFTLKDKQLTKYIKDERHKLREIAKQIGVVEFRNSSKDFGKDADFDDSSYKNILELTLRNLKRAQEGCRVIEEFSKLFDESLSPVIKKIRFKTY